jgi:flagellar biosynthesis protein FliR
MNAPWLWMLMLVRTASFIALFPPWAGRALPQSVKAGFAFALTVFWAGDLSGGDVALPDGWIAVAAGAIREAIVGGLMAQVVGLALVPPRIAGSYIAQEMGLTFAALASPIDQHPSDPIAQIFEAISLALFFVLNGHHFVLRMLDASWRIAPCGTVWPAPIWARCAVVASSSVEAGLAIAASVGVIMLVVTVWMALAARVAPQMHLFAWGMSARIVIGLIALLIYLPELILACCRTLLSEQGLFLFE